MATHTLSTVTITPPATLTNLGPLLTPIALPPACLETLLDMGTPGLGLPGSQDFLTKGCALSSCCPSSKPYTTGWAWISSYYSPAVCPVSYQVCRPPAEVTATKLGEMVAFCCPSSFSCPGNLDNNVYDETWFGCFSTLTSASVAYLVDNIISQNILGTSSLSSISAGTNVRAYYAIIAYPIQIRWKSDDFPTSTTSAAAPSTPTTALTTVPPTSTAAAAAQSNGNLATGAIAGIAVGAFVAAILAIACLFRFIRSHRRRAAGGLQQPTSAAHPYPYSEKGGTAVQGLPHSDNRPISEMYAPAAVLTRRAELPPAGRYRA